MRINRHYLNKISRLLSACLVVLPMALFPHILRAEERGIRSSIVRVVVYPRSAQVERHASVQLTTGENRLLFPGLPWSMEPSSLRARVRGKGAIVLDVTSYPSVSTESGDPEWRSLEESLEEMKRSRDEARSELVDLKSDDAGIVRYTTLFSGILSRLSTERTTPAETRRWVQTLDLLRKRRTGNEERALKLRDRIAELEEKITSLTARIREIRSRGEKKSRTVELRLRSERAGAYDVVLSGIVSGTSWKPSYGFYLKGKSIHVIYYGEIVQNTGEEWKDSRIVLSTSTPSLGGNRPPLHPLFVNAREVASKKVYVMGESNIPEGAPGSAGAEPEKDTDASTGGFSGIETKGEQVWFEIPGRHSISTGGEAGRVTLAEYEAAVDGTEYRVVPSLQSSAYLEVRLKNDRNFPLLAGSADLFRDSGFVCRSRIDYTPAGSPLSVGFGTDATIRVDRATRNFREEGGALTREKVFVSALRTHLVNRGKGSRRIVLYERSPVAQSEDFRVEILSGTTPGYQWDRESGVYRWETELAPGESREFLFTFRVHAPLNYPGEIYGN